MIRWLFIATCVAACGINDAERPRAAMPSSQRGMVPAARSTASAPRATASTRLGTAPAPAPSSHVASDDDRVRYPFLSDGAVIRTLESAASTPPGFARVALAPDSFGAWLRGLPLRAPATPVRSYDGSVLHEGDDARIFAVAELDVSRADLQQCADSVIRLHAEWLWSRGEAKRVGYHFVSGDYASFDRHASGVRPEVEKTRVRWVTKAKARADRRAFREYLDLVFTYASTISLAREAKPVDRAALAPGDFLILPGGPGHVVLVLDVAEDGHGRRVALLGQGYMPAQDFHVLASREGELSPWFSLAGEHVDTPFWPAPFPWSSLRRL